LFRYGIIEKSLKEIGDSYTAYRRSTNEALKEATELKNHTTVALEDKHD